MKPGDTVFLRRPKRMMRATVVNTEWRALRVKMAGRVHVRIVGCDEVLTIEAREAERLQMEQEAAELKYADIIAKYDVDMTWNQWMDKTGNGPAWNQFRRLQRLGVLTTNFGNWR